MDAGEMQRHGAPGLARRGAGNGIDLGAAPPLEFGGEVRLRLDQHAGPAALFEVPGLRQIFRVVGADLDEIAGAGTGEEGFLQLVFHLRREHRSHGAHALTGFLRLGGCAGSRERLTSRLVLCPGTKSTSTTSPPAASTTSAPTTSS